MAEAESTRAASSPTDPLALPLGFVFTLALASIGALHELAAVQPAAYLVNDFGPPRGVATALGLAGFALGALAMRSTSKPEARLVWGLTLSALVTGASAPLSFAAFGRMGPVGPLALGLPALGGFLLGATIALAWRALGKTLMALDAGSWLASPFRLLVLALVAVVSAAAASAVGILRSALAPAMILAVLGVAWAPLYMRLYARPLAQARKPRAFALFVCASCSLGFIASESWIPASEIRRYTNPIVYREKSDRQLFVFTSGQETFELHVDGRLKLSGVDEARYFQALVHPALAVAPRAKKVLVLGGGTGLLERELLKDERVEAVTVVALDRSLVSLSSRNAWLARRGGGALGSPKLAIVEAEPIVWLGETSERFDLIVSDLPDPESYTAAKNYTRFFYRRLAERLESGGVVVVQAASPFGSARAFASVDATLRAAGFSTYPYHAPIPTFGDWGFVLATRGHAPEAELLSRAARFLSGVSVTELEYVPPDVRSREPAEVSTLHDQRVVELFHHERGAP